MREPTVCKDSESRMLRGWLIGHHRLSCSGQGAGSSLLRFSGSAPPKPAPRDTPSPYGVWQNLPLQSLLPSREEFGFSS